MPPSVAERFENSDEEPMKLYCYNTKTSNISHNAMQHDKTKHIEVERQFTNEKSEQGLNLYAFVRSEDRLADAFTKVLSGKDFSPITCKLGMREIYAKTWGKVLCY